MPVIPFCFGMVPDLTLMLLPAPDCGLDQVVLDQRRRSIPGTPFFYLNNSGAGETNTFVGSVTLSNVVTLVAGNYSFAAETAPVADTLDGTNLNLPLSPGDDVLLWNGNGYDTWAYAGPGVWLGPAGPAARLPRFTLVEAFFYFNNSGSTEYWTNNVTVQ